MHASIDRESRRLELVEALWRVVARHGIGAASVRGVAAEAGWTRGTIEHYFADRDELLAMAGRCARERVLESARRRGAPAGRVGLREILLSVFSLQPRGSDAAGVWLGLIAASNSADGLRVELHRLYWELSSLLAEVITEMKKSGEVAPELDPALAAQTCLQFCGGLAIGTHLAPEQHGEEQLGAEIEGFLDRLIPAKAIDAS